MNKNILIHKKGNTSIPLNFRPITLESTVLVVINGVWNLVIKRFGSKFIPSNNIYSSNKAYVGKIFVVLDTIHLFRGVGLFLTRYIPMQLRVLL